jgi:hypothetical protein
MIPRPHAAISARSSLVGAIRLQLEQGKAPGVLDLFAGFQQCTTIVATLMDLLFHSPVLEELRIFYTAPFIPEDNPSSSDQTLTGISLLILHLVPRMTISRSCSGSYPTSVTVLSSRPMVCHRIRWFISMSAVLPGASRLA